MTTAIVQGEEVGMCLCCQNYPNQNQTHAMRLPEIISLKIAKKNGLINQETFDKLVFQMGAEIMDRVNHILSKPLMVR